MGISNVLELLGGVALFLFGMALMGDSLKKVAGNKLELILFRLSSTPLKGISARHGSYGRYPVVLGHIRHGRRLC